MSCKKPNCQMPWQSGQCPLHHYSDWNKGLNVLARDGQVSIVSLHNSFIDWPEGAGGPGFSCVDTKFLPEFFCLCLNSRVSQASFQKLVVLYPRLSESTLSRWSYAHSVFGCITLVPHRIKAKENRECTCIYVHTWSLKYILWTWLIDWPP